MNSTSIHTHATAAFLSVAIGVPVIILGWAVLLCFSPRRSKQPSFHLEAQVEVANDFVRRQAKKLNVKKAMAKQAAVVHLASFNGVKVDASTSVSSAPGAKLRTQPRVLGAGWGYSSAVELVAANCRHLEITRVVISDVVLLLGFIFLSRQVRAVVTPIIRILPRAEDGSLEVGKVIEYCNAGDSANCAKAIGLIFGLISAGIVKIVREPGPGFQMNLGFIVPEVAYSRPSTAVDDEAK
ncbi:hypothetical protein QBC34DRAFT_493843 [Podospora aff. communis PSN243]|uniref:Uncharacterized protein n=1 Tax=Podospora aff. communis PSN243 TaxID=3040156 RepID=A0AAV9GT23_9PEZI|nr:hypothetical protein QBC34DRAFT_493843 [Podospora aff. communis PSN243]